MKKCKTNITSRNIKVRNAIMLTIITACFLFQVNACSKCQQECSNENPHEKHGIAKHHHAHEGESIQLTAEVKKQISLKTITVEAGTVESTLNAMGKVVAPNDRKAIVGFAFSGRIVKLHAAVGNWVAKGAPLVSLECEEVGNAQSEFVKSITDYELSKLDYDREDRLYKKDIGAKKDYLEAKAKLQIAQACMNAAEKKLTVLGFSKKQINEISKSKNVSPHITVNAPIAGRIVKNDAIIGAMIDASTEVMVIMDLSSLWIDAEIYEKDISKIKKDQEVKISVPAYPGEVFSGKIHYIGDVVHSETRTISVRTLVHNTDSKLKPGMFADITIMTGLNKNAVIVPTEAVLDDGDRKIVFVAQGENGENGENDKNYIYREVKTGTGYNGHIEIISGLKAGEKVVTEGNYQLKSMLRADEISHGHTH